MEASVILKKTGIKPDEPILLITAEESLENLLNAVEEYCPNLKVNKITKEDIMTLLKSYANCIINYHPEDDHQERGALLENSEMLEKYGLTEDDYDAIDFC